MMNHKLLLILYSVLQLSIAQTSDKKIVCYYTDWSVYRPGNAMFSPRSIHPNICTHLIYAFAKFSDDGGIAPFDEWQDITRKGYSEFNEVKALNENIRTLLAIGGWTEGSARFSRTAATQDRRIKFSDSVVQFLRLHNFDGINLDWQFPGFREGSREEDFENYVELVKDLRMTFENESITTNQPRLLVTMSVPSELEYIEKGYDLLNLQRYADFINILCYDYHLSYDPFVNHHAPLYPLPEETGDHPNAKLNVQSTITYLLDKGVRREILNLGIPTFGRTFILEDPENNGLGAPAKGQGVEGEATRERGYKAYYEVCKDIRNDNWTIVYVNRSALGPYAYKGENWVGYDDEFSVRNKAEYARDIGLGGIMFWTIDDDDFRGECGTRGNPLIKAAREALLARPPSPMPTINVTRMDPTPPTQVPTLPPSPPTMPSQPLPPAIPPQQMPPITPVQQLPPTIPPQQLPPILPPPQQLPPALPPQQMPPGIPPFLQSPPAIPPPSQQFPPAMPPQQSPPSIPQQPFPPAIPPQQSPPSIPQQPFPPAMPPQQSLPSIPQQPFPPAIPQQPFPPAMPPQQSPPEASPGQRVQPIQVTRKVEEGKNTYFQEITIWIINNIFNFNIN